ERHIFPSRRFQSFCCRLAWAMTSLPGSSKEPPNSIGYPVNLRLGQGQPRGNIKSPLREALRNWVALAEEKASLQQCGLFVHAEKEWPCIYSERLESSAEFGSIHGHVVIQNHPVHPIDVLRPLAFDRERQSAQISQALVIQACHPPFLRDM